MADDVKQFTEKYRSSGNCTAPCTDPVQKDEALIMADSGGAAAVLWCKFNRWLPLAWKPSQSTNANAVALAARPPGHALDQRGFAESLLALKHL